MPRRPDGCLSDLMLDRLLGGELASIPDRERTEAHLRDCSACRARRQQIEAASGEAPDAGWWQARRNSRRRRQRTLLALGGVAAAAAVIVLTRLPVADETKPGATRVKGGNLVLDVVVQRKTAGEPEPVLPDIPLHPGEIIRFRIRTAQAGVLSVVGMDAGGKVSSYARSIHLFERSQRQLDEIVTLDSTLGTHKVFAVLCSEGNTAPVVAAAEAALRQAGAPERVLGLGLPCLEAQMSFRTEPAP